MNDTLRKYELMKKLQIPVAEFEPHFWEYRDEKWYEGDRVVPDFAAAAILERACREWLEKEQSIYIAADDQGFYYAFYMQRSTDPITGIECEYDAAQIAALEYCLKEKSNV